ncbi:flagellin [Reinekea forsetii]|nr:flagellin [Reinekea forsetii]
MPQIINSNIASLTAQRNLNSSQSANSTALERLSSGLRINSAKDDAAGLAISTKFESQVKGLNVAIRNAGDGISLAQTAEGALGAMTENLQRIRELAVQSSNATNSDDDRVALQQEVQQLMAEVTRTAEETNFNGRNLLDGSFEGTFQIGSNAGNTVEVKISELTADKLGSSAQAGVSASGNSSQLGNGDLVINGESIRASVSGDDTLSFEGKEYSGISKAAAINSVSDQTGVVATVDENIVLGSDMATSTATGSAAAAATISLNGVSIDIEGTDNADDSAKAATRGSVIESINAKSEQTGVVASDGGNDGGVILTASDGRNITVTSAATNNLSVYGLADSDTAGTAAVQSQAGFTLTSKNSSIDIEISGGNGTGNGDITNSGLTAGTYTAQTAATSSTKQEVNGVDGAWVTVNTTNGTAALLTAAATAGSLTIGTAAGDTLADLQAAFDDAGFDVTVAADTQEGIAVAVNEAKASEKRIGDGDLVINGVAIKASSSLDDTASDTTAGSSDGAASAIAIAATINKASGDTGVTAEVNATEVVGGAKNALGLVESDGTAGVLGTDVVAGASIQLTVNGVNVSLVETEDYEKNKAGAITAINEVSGQTGVIATDNGETLTLTAADGRNISLFADSADAGESLIDLNTHINNFGLSADNVGQNTGTTGVKAFTYASGAETTYGTVTLSSAKSFDVSFGTAGAQALEDSGLTAGTFGGGQDGTFLKDVDISTFQGAQDAITAIDNALSTVTSQRAELGALQNRFESTSSNLQITSENLSAANSRIRDADFAAETAELSRTQVLQQAGISILAQANQRPQQVLSLLG